jgi:hypothetical protein
MQNLLFNYVLPYKGDIYTNADDMPLGIVYTGERVENQPAAWCTYLTISGGGARVQFAFSAVNDGIIYKRNRTNTGVWSGWFKFTGSQLT